MNRRKDYRRHAEWSSLNATSKISFPDVNSDVYLVCRRIVYDGWIMISSHENRRCLPGNLLTNSCTVGMESNVVKAVEGAHLQQLMEAWHELRHLNSVCRTGTEVHVDGKLGFESIHLP